MKPSPTRVLIIDDDPLIRSLLVSTLRKDCLVAVATEGSEGFFEALELKPDVAVIDVNMPGWDGLRTLETFRTHPELKDVKVIMLTADASKQTVMAAIHGGAHDYIIKTSFSKADFHRKLNRLVPGSISDVSQLAEPVNDDGSEASCHAAPRRICGRRGRPVCCRAAASRVRRQDRIGCRSLHDLDEREHRVAFAGIDRRLGVTRKDLPTRKDRSLVTTLNSRSGARCRRARDIARRFRSLPLESRQISLLRPAENGLQNFRELRLSTFREFCLQSNSLSGRTSLGAHACDGFRNGRAE